jgi:hypothetical protein
MDLMTGIVFFRHKCQLKVQNKKCGLTLATKRKIKNKYLGLLGDQYPLLDRSLGVSHNFAMNSHFLLFTNQS